MIKFRKNVKLAPLSTFGIGGRAEYFCDVRNPEDLIRGVVLAKELGLPFRIFGGGSNIVFPDGRLGGLLIRFRGGRVAVRGNRFIADAGVDLGTIVKKSINLGFRGLETLSGIPGTLGGAVVGNAGAYGHSISELIKRVEIWDPFDVTPLDSARGRQGRQWISKSQCKFDYRESVFSTYGGSAAGRKHKPRMVLRVELSFKKGDKKKLKEISREIIKVREKKYKLGTRCPGSFFKNVLVRDISKKSLKLIDKSKIIDGKIPAGYLLEKVGAKGMRSGGIRIADFHGNLLMNTGGAKAADTKKLARILKERVRRKFGIKLEEEVRYF